MSIVVESSPAERLEPSSVAFRRTQLRVACAAGIVLAAAALLLTWPEHLPGLHLDEAWCFFRADEIMDGARPIDGMNYYTGALQQYLLAAAVSHLGRHVWVARLLSGLFNVAMLLSYMQLVRQLHPGKDTWLWTGALTATSATFVIFSRFATEITALTPFLIVTGLMLAQRGWTVSRAGWAWAFAGGVLFGLSVYNHMAGVAVVAALGFAYLIATGWRCVLDPKSYAGAAGVLVGLIPRFYQLQQVPDGSRSGPMQRLRENLSPEVLADLPYLPHVLRGMADGDLLYRNVAGRCLLRVAPFFTLALIALILVRVVRKRWAFDRRVLALCVAIVSASVLVTLIAKGLALRYFVLPVLALPYLLARAGSSDGENGLSAGERKLRTGILGAVVGLQTLYVGVNYFYSHLSTGGGLGVFPLGARLLETSDAYTRTDRLYKQLVEKGIEHVIAYDVIRWPLQYYDYYLGQFRTAVVHGQRAVAPDDGPSAVIHYNGYFPGRGMNYDDFTPVDSVDVEGVEFRIDKSFDPNFRVYVYRPGEHP